VLGVVATDRGAALDRALGTAGGGEDGQGVWERRGRERRVSRELAWKASTGDSNVLGPPQTSSALPAHAIEHWVDVAAVEMSTFAEEPQKHWLEYSMPARSKPFDAQKSVQTSCVIDEDSVDAPSKRRPLAPSRRQRLVFCQPLASGAGVDKTAALWKM
jgi:hypothetical protein